MRWFLCGFFVHSSSTYAFMIFLYPLIHSSVSPILCTTAGLCGCCVPNCCVPSSVPLVVLLQLLLSHVDFTCALSCAVQSHCLVLLASNSLAFLTRTWTLSPARSVGWHWWDPAHQCLQGSGSLPLGPSAGTDGFDLVSFFQDTHGIASAQSISRYWQHPVHQYLLCIWNPPAWSISRYWQHPVHQYLLCIWNPPAWSISRYWQHPVHQHLLCIWNPPAWSISRYWQHPVHQYLLCIWNPPAWSISRYWQHPVHQYLLCIWNPPAWSISRYWQHPVHQYLLCIWNPPAWSISRYYSPLRYVLFHAVSLCSSCALPICSPSLHFPLLSGSPHLLLALSLPFVPAAIIVACLASAGRCPPIPLLISMLVITSLLGPDTQHTIGWVHRLLLHWIHQ